MNQTLKVFVACAIGAFLGAFTALQVTSHFWWFGLLVGFAAGYISYEFKKVLALVPKAWNKATAWKPNWDYWKEFARYALYGMGLCVSVFVPTLALPTLAITKKESLVAVYVIAAIGTLLVGLLFGLCYGEDCYERDRRQLRAVGNPIKNWLWVVNLILKAIWFLISRIPAATIVLGRFAWFLFKEIHSDMRLLCGTDAAIGAGIGYYCGNAFIGMLAGGIFGVLNFEILSKRVLKLVPVRAKQ